ncbi:MAG: iron-sulfur cluster assembly scaffold protein [Pseudomonadota bacterium]
MNQPLYTREVLRLAVSIPHEGRLQDPQGTAEMRSQTCGSRVVADIRISPDQMIEELGIEVNACALGQASTAIVAREAIGKSATEIQAARDHLRDFLKGKRENPGNWQDIDLLATAKDYPGRHGAILLPYDAIIEALEAAADVDEVN